MPSRNTIRFQSVASIFPASLGRNNGLTDLNRVEMMNHDAESWKNHSPSAANGSVCPTHEPDPPTCLRQPAMTRGAAARKTQAKWRTGIAEYAASHPMQ